MHSLLKRQLRRHFKDDDSFVEKYSAFLGDVDAAYRQGDSDRLMLERALDISSMELLEANAGLREAMLRFESVIEKSPLVAIQGFDREGVIMHWNRSSADLYGLDASEAIGRRLQDLILSGDEALAFMETLDRIWVSGQPAPLQERNTVTADGEKRTVYSSMFPVFDAGGVAEVFCMDVDITERIRMQSQLLQAQKMEAVATLVGGIAHDFNNILGGIIGSLSLIEMLIPKDGNDAGGDLVKYVNTALESSRRAAEITKSLMTLSRKSELKLEEVDAAHSLRNVLKLCKNTFPKNIILDFLIGDRPLPIKADPVQIEQVFLNLCVNASHAMTIMRPDMAQQGGILTVETRLTTCDESVCARHAEAIPGIPYVTVSVRDTGVGMDDETRNQVFDPFFSLKRQDQGTGLGLALVYGIIKQHSGFIDVFSAPGKGSTFEVYIPSTGEIRAHRDKSSPAEALVHGSGRILVIDDEKAILSIARGMLEMCGYDILTAEGGTEGIETYRKEHDNIDGVLMDLAMPGISGLEVFAALKEINPGVRVLITSGLIDDDELANALDRGVMGFLQKPYTAAELSTGVRRLLE